MSHVNTFSKTADYPLNTYQIEIESHLTGLKIHGIQSVS